MKNVCARVASETALIYFLRFAQEIDSILKEGPATEALPFSKHNHENERKTKRFLNETKLKRNFK